jgi:outer membrane protein assembly factor BamB
MVRFAEDNLQHQIGDVPALSFPIASDTFDWSRLNGAMSKTTTLAPVGTSLLSPLYVSRPGVLPDGTVVAALRTGNDVVAINPAATTGTLDHTTWRAHPGGALLTCVTIGQITVATTSERRIVAYGPTGVVLWIASSPDSVDQPAIAFGGQLVVTSVDGTVMALNPSTGHETWRAKTPSELALQPVASGDTMVVIDENGTTVAFGSDGHERWRSTEFPASVFAISAGVVIVNERGAPTLRGYDVASGNKLWRAWGPAAVVSLSDLDGVVVAYLGREGAAAFDPATGSLLWMVNQKTLDLLVVGNRAVLATTENVVVLSRDGTEVARIPHGLSRLPQLNVFIAAGASSLDAITTAELFREVLS